VTAVEDVILVGGEALYDLVVDASEQVRAHAGGGPFNAARTIGRLEAPVAYLGRVSTDRFGATLHRMLADDGVHLHAVVRTDEPTTLAVAEIDAAGSARYRFYERGTSVPGLTTQAALAAVPASVAILHVVSLGLVFEPIATALESVVDELAGRALIVVDPNVRPFAIADAAAYRERLGRILAHTDVVKVSDDDLAWLEPDREPDAAARALLLRGPRVVLLTRGGEGAIAMTADDEVAVPAPPVAVVDTIGAGDSFGGGFVAWWHSHGLGRDELDDTDRVLEATRFAALVAARTCARPGAQPPFLRELDGG
jgi:fructokinase